MNELRAIIVDDEQKGIDALSLLISTYTKGIKAVACTTSAPESIELIGNYKPEIVFLDINMPEMNGFELLKGLAWKDFNLVFTTAHQEYAIQAIRSSAVDYLLKPIDYEDLQQAVERIKIRMEKQLERDRFNYTDMLERMLQPHKHKMLISSRSGIESIDTRDIVCLESQSNYTKIYLAGGTSLLTSKTMKELEALLGKTDPQFMRVHHSFVVNLNKVSRYLKASDSIVMNNDQHIPLAKSRRAVFLKWLDI